LRHILLCAAALTCAAAVVLAALARPAPAPAGERRPAVNAATAATTVRLIHRYRKETWRWQMLMRRKRTVSPYAARGSANQAYQARMLRLWKRRAVRARRQAHNPPRRAAWLCIYRHERHPRMAWRTRTGNGFFGGLQMDLAFQRTYGPELLRRKGTADRWTAIEQIWVAERAYRTGQGFYPWPRSARSCGLI
jgi:Transglycosylase-like domain